MLDLTQSVLADPEITRMDSCTTADHPLIDHLWRDRLAIADRMIAHTAGARRGLRHGLRAGKARRTGIHYARMLRTRLRG